MDEIYHEGGWGCWELEGGYYAATTSESALIQGNSRLSSQTQEVFSASTSIQSRVASQEFQTLMSGTARSPDPGHLILLRASLGFTPQEHPRTRRGQRGSRTVRAEAAPHCPPPRRQLSSLRREKGRLDRQLVFTVAGMAANRTRPSSPPPPPPRCSFSSFSFCRISWCSRPLIKPRKYRRAARCLLLQGEEEHTRFQVKKGFYLRWRSSGVTREDPASDKTRTRLAGRWSLHFRPT